MQFLTVRQDISALGRCQEIDGILSMGSQAMTDKACMVCMENAPQRRKCLIQNVVPMGRLMEVP